MTYALISNNAVAQYPYSFEHLRRDNPEVSFPLAPSDDWLAAAGVVKIAAVAAPARSGIDKTVVEGAPAKVGGVWLQTWIEVAATPGEIAQRQRQETDASQRATIKADQFVSNFIAMTPAEVAAYVDTNVTSLATAKNVIAKLGIMVLLLARREFGEC